MKKLLAIVVLAAFGFGVQAADAQGCPMMKAKADTACCAKAKTEQTKVKGCSMCKGGKEMAKKQLTSPKAKTLASK